MINLSARLACAERDKIDDIGRGGPASTVSPRRARTDWMPLDADAMVKPSLGTLLGGHRKDTITDITRI